jgi:hypothetical protein
MSALLNLNHRQLKVLECLSTREDARLFKVPGTGDFVMVIHGAVPASHTHPAEDPRPPTHEECAELLGGMFRELVRPDERRAGQDAPATACGGTPQPQPAAGRHSHGSDEQQDGPGPDFAKGWEAYRRELRETHACVVPPWEVLPLNVQECWCVGVWAVLDPFCAGGAQ